MQAGTTKDQGLYNKPSAAVHPVALADGNLTQYNTIQCCGKRQMSISSLPELMSKKVLHMHNQNSTVHKT